MSIQTSVIHSSYLQDFFQKALEAGAQGWKADPKFPVMDAGVISVGLIREVKDVEEAPAQQPETTDEVSKPAVTQPKSPGRPPLTKK